MSKEAVCYQIFKKYSMIVNFEGEPATGNFFELDEDETFACWKKRVLGDNVSNVVLYAPLIKSPGGNTLISTLQHKVGSDHLNKIFKLIINEQGEQKRSSVKKAIKKTKNSLTSFPKETLKGAASEEVLEEPVRAFIDRFLKESPTNIDAVKIVDELLKSYNQAVSSFRAEKAKCDRLQSENNQLKLSVKSAGEP